MNVVLVTGASAGIGLAIADRFASGGWNVAIVARGPSRLADAKAWLERHGGRVVAIVADVSDADAVEAAARSVLLEFGRLDAWVNNAMSTVVAHAHEITPHEYARVTSTTYLSQVHGTLAALRHMRAQDRGAIVQMSSGLALRAAPLQAAYCAAKAAVTGFTDAVRAELIAGGSTITLSVVYLPGVNLPQPRWARNLTGRRQVVPDPLFDPRLCAEAVWTAVLRPQREFWVGHSTFLMAMGQWIAPGMADRRAASMIERQQGDAAPMQEGNLDRPVDGPAAIDGDDTSRVKPGRGEFLSSRQWSLMKLGGVTGIFGAGLLAGWGASRLFAGSRQ